MSLSTTNKFKILILGGYGVFGQRLTSELMKPFQQHFLSKHPDTTANQQPSHVNNGPITNFDIIIGGRNLQHAQEFARSLNTKSKNREDFNAFASGISVDIQNEQNFKQTLQELQPNLVIHTCGPFQGQDYHVAEECIENGIHYLDLADSRLFVSQFSKHLNEKALKHNVVAISGVSTVPGLSSAVIKYCSRENNEFGFKEIHNVECNKINVIGWQGLKKIQLKGTSSTRHVSYCDVPDIDLFPEYFPQLKEYKFRAGLELGIFQFGLLGMSYLTRMGMVKNWANYAPYLKRISEWFYNMGTDSGGMQMILKGIDHQHNLKIVQYDLIALKGDGPQIPSTPAVILARKIAQNQLQIGAQPCVGQFTLDELMEALKEFNISHSFSIVK
ncbi:hypothetical protein C9374_000764 [Naegleria lovaniensis]|uniref:Saccharopine dehydrogenase NADP binding domain-containing protein n=1 Tax=Naegleria lovaniensis TaxID=51637 RepID=A0AA88GXI4_NAELO|nr:uncharacterized protein C9374_000764 [Naegleria lovaniensis]KAG2387914.1 hypothetical protein C9374_000764 [Naegleria lovaniensis]